MKLDEGGREEDESALEADDGLLPLEKPELDEDEDEDEEKERDTEEEEEEEEEGIESSATASLARAVSAVVSGTAD